jgi:hypothetical protein
MTNIGITSIQRDRGPYILEWLAFHMVVGFNKFYIYNHGADELQKNILIKLSQGFPNLIYPHQVGLDVDRPQIAAYRHAWEVYGKCCDAMAFIDGDEFLFSPDKDFATELSDFFTGDASALGIYWMIYGSSGHVEEPEGLIIDNFKRHARFNFSQNSHIKTIVRGGETINIAHSHLFGTKKGTFDEMNRLIDRPIMSELVPSMERFRLNHYTVQSYNYFLNKKRNSGQADLPRENLFQRPDSWFESYDRNECDDGVIYNYLIKTKIQLSKLKAVVDL